MTKDELLKSIPDFERLYIIFSKLTHLPYIERNSEVFDTQVFIFTDEASAITRAKTLTEERNKASMAVKIEQHNILKMFSEFYAYGIDVLICQTGQDYYRLYLEEIIRRPDFTKLPENKRPLLNPQFQLSMLYYMQELRQAKKDTDKKQLMEMDKKMVVQILCARYLIPFKESQNEDGQKKLQLIILKGPNGTPVVPVFSDTVEFNHFKGKQDIKVAVSDFTKMAAMNLPKEVAGFIINPSGVSLALSRDYIQKLLQNIPRR